MGEKLCVTRKTITTEKQSTLINWRRSDRIDVSRGAQFNRGFDVTSRCFTSRTRLDAGFDKATDIVEMINDRLGKLIGKRLSSANDVVA